MGEAPRFFDHCLAEAPNGCDREAPVHCCALHEESSRAADQRPPPPGTIAPHPGAAGLATAPQAAPQTAPQAGTAPHAAERSWPPMS